MARLSQEGSEWSTQNQRLQEELQRKEEELQKKKEELQKKKEELQTVKEERREEVQEITHNFNKESTVFVSTLNVILDSFLSAILIYLFIS